MAKKNPLIIASSLFLLLIALLVYSNSISVPFLLDDDILIKGNPYIRDFGKIGNIFKSNIAAGAGLEGNYYRPLYLMTYMIDYRLWKLNIIGSHCVNILLHVAAALAVYWLANILFCDGALSFFASSLFLVHPVHCATVVNLGGRVNSLLAIFVLFCLIFYIKNNTAHDKRFFMPMLLCCACALLIKETSVMIPFAVLLYHVVFKKKVRWLPLLSVGACVLFYLVLRSMLLKGSLFSVARDPDLLKRIPGFFVAIATYIRILVLPFNLHFDYGNKYFASADPAAVAGMVLIVLLGIIAIRARNANRLVVFSIGWFFLYLLPVSNIYPMAFFMAEHFLYVPSLGFFLVASQGLASLYEKNRRAGGALFIAVLTAYSLLTVRQNYYWGDPIRFYTRELTYTQNLRMYACMGMAYRDCGKRKEAIGMFRKAVKMDPKGAMGYYFLASVYQELGSAKKAEYFYKKVAQGGPTSLAAYNALGHYYATVKKTAEAIEQFKQIIRRNPTDADTWFSLAMLYSDKGEDGEAVRLYEHVLRIAPRCVEAYNNLGICYVTMGKYREAEELFQKALTIEPDYAVTYVNLAKLYSSTGRENAAQDYYSKAVERGYKK